MEIQFVGPLGKVTGSCAWLRDEGRKWSFLVDCGMQQGEYDAPRWNRGELWPFKPSDIQFVILTHAHIDHSGLLPELYRQGFKGRVFCTRATRKIAEVLLRDAARFSATPYDEGDVDRIRWNDRKLKHGKATPLDTDLFVQVLRNGHILGSVSARVLWGKPKDPTQRSILFSGDVGPGSEDNEVLPFLRFPLNAQKSNFAVLESTYGSTVRTAQERDPGHRRAQLAALLDRIVATKGTLAIPSFSVGRAQDIMFDLSYLVAAHPEQYGQIEYLLDSPTASKISKITLEMLSETVEANGDGKIRPMWLGKQLLRDLGLKTNCRQDFDAALQICQMTLGGEAYGGDRNALGNQIAQQWRPIFSTVTDREQILDAPGPRVILMGSGTCDGGPAATWLPRLLSSPENTVALSGYCSPKTVGGSLLQLGGLRDADRELHTTEVTWRDHDGSTLHSLQARDIKANITQLTGYSAHGDQIELVRWVFDEHASTKGGGHPRSGVFLNHGEDKERYALKDALEAKAHQLGIAVPVECPDESAGWFDLEDDYALAPLAEDNRKVINREIAKLKARLQQLERRVA